MPAQHCKRDGWKAVEIVETENLARALPMLRWSLGGGGGSWSGGAGW